MSKKKKQTGSPDFKTGIKSEKMPSDLSHKIKVINQRMYRLENTFNEYGNSYANQSAQYRMMRQYAVEEPTSKNAKVSQGIYKVDEDKGTIRLKGASEWGSLSDEAKKKLISVVNDIWEDPSNTTQIRAIKYAHTKAYVTWMKNHPEARQQGITFEEYSQMWQETTDYSRARQNEHFGSDQVTMLVQGYDVPYLLKTNQWQDALDKLRNKRATEIDRAAVRRFTIRS